MTQPASLALSTPAAPASPERAIAPGLTGPGLTLRPDMARAWRAVDVDFDTGANLLIAAHAADGLVEDIEVHNLKHWTIVPYQGGMALAPVSGYRPPMPLRRSAFSDLCQRLGAPAAFLRDKMPPALQVGPLMHLLRGSTDTRKAIFRCRKGEVTAIVSGSYAAVSAADLVEHARQALASTGLLGAVRVRGVASGMVDALRLSFPSEAREIKRGDVSEALVDLENSEFGDSAVYVKSGVYRLVCTNGMRRYQGRAQSRFNHAGNAQRLRSSLAEAMPAAMAEATGMLDAWSKSVDVMLSSLADQLEALYEYDYTQAQVEAVGASIAASAGVKALPAGSPVTLYDLVNGMTDAAKGETVERRLELETIAGRVLQRGGAA